MNGCTHEPLETEVFVTVCFDEYCKYGDRAIISLMDEVGFHGEMLTIDSVAR